MKKRVTTFVLVLVLVCLSACEKKAAVANPPAATVMADTSPRAGLLAGANEDDLLVVLTNPRSNEYIAFNDAGAQSYELQSGGDVILLVPLKDNLEIAVMSVEYDFDGMYFNWTDTIFEFTGRSGEPVKLTAFLSEGIPSLMLYVQYGNRFAYWYLAYDGVGNENVLYLKGGFGEG